MATKKNLVIGVLALQGDFFEHQQALQKLDVEVKLVKTIADAKTTAGLILPGGESTAIGLQLRESGLGQWLKTATKQRQYPIYGTCAGCILIAKNVDSDFSLRLMDITVQRNAYGRQLDSFDEPITSKQFHNMRGVFIRAPRIARCGPNIEVLAKHNSDVILARQQHLLAGTFHPELTGDLRVHAYFVKMIKHYA